MNTNSVDIICDFYLMYSLCVSECICMDICAVAVKVKRGHWFARTGITGSCELSGEYGELNPGLVLEQ